MEAAHEDPTRVYDAEDKQWMPVPEIPKGEAWIKVIHTDPDRGVVLFRFRFSPGSELVPHTHRCHAIAYTIAGEWEYEGLTLGEGAVAYEPLDSTHTPSSGPGAELFTVLTSETDQFLINHMPDGSDIPFDMAFFQALEGISSEEEAQALLAQLQDG
jgi:quercetin dioxygenase-like cupin family protein